MIIIEFYTLLAGFFILPLLFRSLFMAVFTVVVLWKKTVYDCINENGK